MTPEELDQSRRHAARMSDAEFGEVYIKGPDQWPPEAWAIVEQEVERRERAKRAPASQFPIFPSFGVEFES